MTTKETLDDKCADLEALEVNHRVIPSAANEVYCVDLVLIWHMILGYTIDDKRDAR